MRADLLLNASRHCKQIDQCTPDSMKAKNHKTYRMSKCGEASSSIHITINDKMKKLVNMMKQMKLIKRLSVSGSLENYQGTLVSLSYHDLGSALDYLLDAN